MPRPIEEMPIAPGLVLGPDILRQEMRWTGLRTMPRPEPGMVFTHMDDPRQLNELELRLCGRVDLPANTVIRPLLSYSAALQKQPLDALFRQCLGRDVTPVDSRATVHHWDPERVAASHSPATLDSLRKRGGLLVLLECDARLPGTDALGQVAMELAYAPRANPRPNYRIMRMVGGLVREGYAVPEQR